MRLSITREVAIPDPVKLERLRRAPEFGPKILFFSGGSALKDACRELVAFSHNSIHIITPFDSGGSSAILRQAFAMPAVGDFRNRLMALADQSLTGNPEIYDLFAHRLDKKASAGELDLELKSLALGRHHLIRRVPDPMRKILRNHCRAFMGLMPAGFNLRGASVGNLVLTAGYLDSRRQFDTVIYLFSKLVGAQGVVRPVVNKNLHLAARLAGGEVVIGQHLLTGKEAPVLTQRIEKLWLTRDLSDPEPVTATVRPKIAQRIAEADLICYPIGSFYSSLVANLLPSGVGRAVAANPCPKVYVPNTGSDPELVGLSLTDQVRVLMGYLNADHDRIEPGRVLGFVLVDAKNGVYPGGLEALALRKLGVAVIDCPLVTKQSAPLLDPGLLAQALASLT
ncbi:MAG: GAK system CofD-like protein [Desulfovibrionaceae bacterium]|nr:GAK system CofD-like protein [Desulfovibrionaceae bacterium]MBF0513753.1 GAK system CofD-like protein [Desulfovibrionaceae bacterium]